MRLTGGAAFGEYRIVRLLGRGASGLVYLAEHGARRNRVALKVSPQRNAEADVLRQLQHPGIVAVLDEFEDENGHVLVMSYVDGFGLDALLNVLHGRSRHRLRTRDAFLLLNHSDPASTHGLANVDSRESFRTFAVRTVQQVAEALACAHAHGVVHRDVKPENILIDSAGQALLIDFHIAQTGTRGTAGVGGSLSYMSPSALQQLAGLAPALSHDRETESPDSQTDLYSLGIVLFELLTGELPYPGIPTGNDVVAAAREAMAQRQNVVQTVRRTNVLPAALRDVIATCLGSGEQTVRYASADKLAEDLNAWQTMQPLRYAPESLPARLQRMLVRYRMGLALMAVLIVSVSLFVWQDRRQTHARLTSVEAALRDMTATGLPTLSPDDEQRLFAPGLLPDSRRLQIRRAAIAHGLATVHADEFPEVAESLLQRAVALDGSSGPMWNDLGVARFRLREFDASIRAFDTALTLECNHAEVLSNRGAAYAALDDADRARRDFERALEIDPDSAAARRHLNLLLDLTE